MQVSDLHIAHLKDLSPAGVNEALLATARHVLEMLSQGFGDAGLNERLREVYQRLSSGSISSVRKAEMEILQAGRVRCAIPCPCDRAANQTQSCMSSAHFFGSFVPNARRLCDQIYERHDLGVARRDVYHELGVSLIESLIHEFDSSSGRAAEPPLDDMDAFFNDLVSDAGGNTAAAFTVVSPVESQTFDFGPGPAQLPTPTSSCTPSSTQTASPSAEQPQQPAAETSEQQGCQKVEANACCELCGYRPKGDPQWFKGSMAKHKKLQHSAEPPRVYKCPFPGCTSQYKNRPDNLRQHQIEKNHWAQGEEGTSRRPSKRKKVAEEE